MPHAYPGPIRMSPIKSRKDSLADPLPIAVTPCLPPWESLQVREVFASSSDEATDSLRDPGTPSARSCRGGVCHIRSEHLQCPPFNLLARAAHRTLFPSLPGACESPPVLNACLCPRQLEARVSRPSTEPGSHTECGGPSCSLRPPLPTSPPPASHTEPRVHR